MAEDYEERAYTVTRMAGGDWLASRTFTEQEADEWLAGCIAAIDIGAEIPDVATRRAFLAQMVEAADSHYEWWLRDARYEACGNTVERQLIERSIP